MESSGISVLSKEMKSDLINIAREFVADNLPYSFTPDEEKALKPFFTNLDKRVFFIHSLPSNVLATLASMYSRLKNKRGIRGVFVDSFLPGVLAGSLESGGDDDVEVFLKQNNVKSLKDFLNYSSEAVDKFNWFVASASNEEYLKLLTDSRKAKKFLNMYLEYGHNSIGRMGTVWLCFEQISILAAKSLEWTRPGVGYVELSTRFVKRIGAGLYPIERELARLGYEESWVLDNLNKSLGYYSELQGDDLHGPFPAFLRERWGSLIEQNGGKVELGVAGETFDVLGNLLPAATLTSVAIAVSGESLPSILKHLILDDTAEGNVLVELVVKEAAKIGADQFIRHYYPSQAEISGWEYMSTKRIKRTGLFENCPSSRLTKNILWEALSLSKSDLEDVPVRDRDMKDIAVMLFDGERGEHDKLPREFELVTVPFLGAMSFRGWRDLHRQGFSTHRRTLLKPNLGFYRYDKPQPPELAECFREVEKNSRTFYYEFRETPSRVTQYILPMGFKVGFIYSANLRQHEFCNWQRTKPSVNHEVRKVFLTIEKELRFTYNWWPLFSRADITPGYVFARGSAVPLPR